jgi:hypothetical protein
MRVLDLLFVFIFVLQTQNVHTQRIAECDEEFGTDINIDDCFNAETQLFFAVQSKNFDRLQPFSLRSKDSTTSLPRERTHLSCGIRVDLKSYAGVSVQTSFRQIQSSLRQLVNDCVKKDGKGGFLHAGGLVFVITNPGLVPAYSTSLRASRFRRPNLRDHRQIQLGASENPVLQEKEKVGTNDGQPATSASYPNSDEYPPLQPDTQRSHKLSRPQFSPHSDVSHTSSQTPMAGSSSSTAPLTPLRSSSVKRPSERQQGPLESGLVIPNRVSPARLNESEIETQDDTPGPRLFSWPPSDGFKFNLGDRVVRYWLWAGRSGWVVSSVNWEFNAPPNEAYQAVEFRKPWEVQKKFPREMPSPTRRPLFRQLQILQRRPKICKCWLWKAVRGSWEPYEGWNPNWWSKPTRLEDMESGWYLILHDAKSVDYNKVVPST